MKVRSTKMNEITYPSETIELSYPTGVGRASEEERTSYDTF